MSESAGLTGALTDLSLRVDDSTARTRLAVSLAAGAVGGWDDSGRQLASLDELWALQAAERDAYYAANATWWDQGGYGGESVEEAMIGDGESEEDVLDSLCFLSALVDRFPSLGWHAALDVGAGVGRVTKHVLLSFFEEVDLVEGSRRWSERSRAYLGAEACASRCRFAHARLEDFTPGARHYDVVWVQWVLQYLTDADAVSLLLRLRAALRPAGLLVLKENRPCTAHVLPNAFLLNTPDGSKARYDITRPDEHHRLLFARAGLVVHDVERGRVEDTSFCISCKRGHRLLKAAAKRLRPFVGKSLRGIDACRLAALLQMRVHLRQAEVGGIQRSMDLWSSCLSKATELCHGILEELAQLGHPDDSIPRGLRTPLPLCSPGRNQAIIHLYACQTSDIHPVEDSIGCRLLEPAECVDRRLEETAQLRRPVEARVPGPVRHSLPGPVRHSRVGRGRGARRVAAPPARQERAQRSGRRVSVVRGLRQQAAVPELDVRAEDLGDDFVVSERQLLVHENVHSLDGILAVEGGEELRLLPKPVQHLAGHVPESVRHGGIDRAQPRVSIGGQLGRRAGRTAFEAAKLGLLVEIDIGLHSSEHPLVRASWS